MEESGTVSEVGGFDSPLALLKEKLATLNRLLDAYEEAHRMNLEIIKKLTLEMTNNIVRAADLTKLLAMEYLNEPFPTPGSKISEARQLIQKELDAAEQRGMEMAAGIVDNFGLGASFNKTQRTVYYAVSKCIRQQISVVRGDTPKSIDENYTGKGMGDDK